MPIPDLYNLWPWNKTYLHSYVVVSFLSAIFLTLLFHSVISDLSFIFLLLIPVGILIHNFYAKIAANIKILKNCKSAQNGEVVESLLAIGHKPSPGVAILRNDVLILIPIKGRRKKIKLENIQSVENTPRFLMPFIWGKSIFKLTTDHSVSMTFALPATIANRWYEQLSRN